jgi:hypothetical protein
MTLAMLGIYGGSHPSMAHGYLEDDTTKEDVVTLLSKKK